MATPSIVPRADGEGQIGTISKAWGRTCTHTLSLADPDVAHGCTNVAETTVYGHLGTIHGTQGGLYINGISDQESASARSLALRGICNDTHTDTVPTVEIIGAKRSGVTVQALAAAETVLQIANHTTTLATVLGSGNVGIGTTTPKTALSTYQDYDTEVFEDQLNDNEGGGEILRYGSAQAGAIGTLHFLHTDGSWDVCDANGVATGGSQLLGIPMGTDPGTDGMLLKGYYRVASGSIDGAAAIGAPVYVADDATGEFDFTAPSGSGDFVRIVGYCIDIDSSNILLYFNPDSTFVEIT